jgi:predicted MFS family arabinose efflux permease
VKQRQEPESAPENSARLLGTRRYGVFWFSSLLSNIGTWMQSVAEPWLVLGISGSSFLLGLDAFAMNAPFWILALLGGVLADRKDRRLIIYFFCGIQMLCPLTIVILGLAGAIKVWIIILLSLIVGITDALSSPAFSSLVPSIVSKEDLKPALALNSIQFNLSRVLGPAIAGLVMMRLGYLWCFGANTASYIPFFFSIYWLRPPARSATQPTTGSGTDFKAIIRSPKTGLALLSVFSTGFFCSPVITFSPVIVKNVLHAGVGEFGGVLTAFGIGGILGPLLILATMKRSDPMKMSLIAAVTYGAIILAVSRAATVWQFAALLVASGFLLTVANTNANTFLQTEATNLNRGQTASLYMLAMRGGMSLGNLATGTVIGLSSPQAAFMINGLLAIAVQAWVFRRLFWKQSAHTKNAQITHVG